MIPLPLQNFEMMNNNNNDQGSSGGENVNFNVVGVAVAGDNRNDNGSSVSSSCCSDEDKIEAVAGAGKDSSPPTRTVSLDGNHGTMLDRVQQQFATRITKPRKESTLDKKRKAKSPLQEKTEDVAAKKYAPSLDAHKKDPSEDEPPSPAKTRRRSCDIKKKPKDMPRRPLSAYNLFFKEERSKVLAEREASLLARQNEPAELPDTELFATMGKTIAARWKTLSSPQRERFKALAAEDMKRYRLEMDAYQLKREMTEAFLTPGMFMGDAGLTAAMGAGANLTTSTTTNAVAAASLRAYMQLQYPQHPTTPPYHAAERQLASSSGTEMLLQTSNRGAANEFIGLAYQPATLESSSGFPFTGTAGMAEILPFSQHQTTTLFNTFQTSTPTSSSFLPAASVPPTLPFASQDLSNMFPHGSNLAAPQLHQSFGQQLQSQYTNQLAQSQPWENQQQQPQQQQHPIQDFSDQDVELQQDLAQLFAQHTENQVNPLGRSASIVKPPSSDELGHSLGQMPQHQQRNFMIPHRQEPQSVSSSMTSWMQPAASGVVRIPEISGPLLSLQQSQHLLLFQEQRRQQQQLNVAIQPGTFDVSSLHLSTQQESEPHLQVSQSAASSRNEFRYPETIVGIQSSLANQATVMFHNQLQQQQQQQEQQQQQQGQQQAQQAQQQQLQDLRFQF